MQHAFPPVREIADGQLLGARSWLNLLSRRSGWLYGHAHGAQRLFRQQQTSVGGHIWTGAVHFDPDRPILNFCGRLKQTSGTAYVSYYGSDDAWHTIWSDATHSSSYRYMTGTADLTQDCSGYSLPTDGVLQLDYTVGYSAGGVMVRAYMSGTNDETWPASLPTFADGEGNEPVDDDFNALRTMQEYERWAARHALLGAAIGKTWHIQSAGYNCLYRWSFRYSGTQQLRLNLTITGLVDTAYIYLIPETYWGAAGDSRLATLETISADVTDEDYAFDLTSQGLTVGNVYAVELGSLDGGAITVNDICLEDLPALSRANVPATWAHKDHITAAQLNAIKADLVEIRDDAGSDSPIWHESWLSAYPPADELAGYAAGPFYQTPGFRFAHRGRYLWYYGSGRIRSVATTTKEVAVDYAYTGDYSQTITAPLFEYSLPGSDPAGQAMCLDTVDVDWLAGAYGMEFVAESNGGGILYAAWESDEAG